MGQLFGLQFDGDIIARSETDAAKDSFSGLYF